MAGAGERATGEHICLGRWRGTVERLSRIWSLRLSGTLSLCSSLRYG